MIYVTRCRGWWNDFLTGKAWHCGQLILTTAPCVVTACTTCQPGNKHGEVLIG